MSQEKFPHGPRKLDVPIAAPRNLGDLSPPNFNDSDELNNESKENKSERSHQNRTTPILMVKEIVKKYIKSKIANYYSFLAREK